MQWSLATLAHAVCIVAVSPISSFHAKGAGRRDHCDPAHFHNDACALTLLSGAFRSSAMGDSDSDLDLGLDGDGTLPSPSTFICVGTREVTLQTSERGKSWPSILACFKSKEDPASNGRGGDDAKASPSALTLMFTDGSRTYSGR